MSGNPMQRPNLPQFPGRMPTPTTPWWNSASPQQRMSYTSAGNGSGPVDFRGIPPNMAPPMGMTFPAGGSGFDPNNAPMPNQEFAANIFGHGSGFPGVPQQRIPQQEQQPSQFSKEVQDEANGYFQQLYSETGAMTVSQFIEKLKNFKNSDNQKDQDVLACVLKNLFDEYRFFHEYPERALRITAEVYGGIIRESLLPTMMQLVTAVRRIIQSFQQKDGTPLYTFGTLALYACKSCLYRYPKLCQIILGLESFRLFTPVLKEYVTYGAQGQLPPNHNIIEQRETSAPSPWPMAGPPIAPPPGGPMGTAIPQPPTAGIAALGLGRSIPGAIPGSALPGMNIPPLGTTPPATMGLSPSPIKFTQPIPGRSSSSMLNATNVDVLMNATDREGSRVAQPPPLIVEKVAFLCNNLSQVNLKQKTEEVRELIRESGEDFLRWFAQYMVMKRVTLEQNFQPLYNSFLLSINDENLDRYVKQETFRNIKILLRSDKGNAASNFGDRQLLKNLGLWLGQITIARSTPILARELDLKNLLFEAFYKGQQELLYVIPFVAKTLLSCTKSELFQPGCAWIYSIIKVLAEIHNEPDLKLNLKFEIEVLCKDLGIDLTEIIPSGVLKDADRLARVPQQLGELASLHQPDTGQPSSTLAAPSMGAMPSVEAGRISGRTSASLMPQTSVTPVNELTAAEQAKQGLAVQPIQNVFLNANFNYSEINVTAPEGLAQHITYPSVPLFQINPELKTAVRPSINQAIKELIGPIAERAISVAIAVTEQVCKKDFALDPDPQHLHRASHQMARSMTAAMAWITCREPLQNTVLGYLNHYFKTILQQQITNPEIAKMMEETVQQTMEANIDLATNFIVKTACEQAMVEVEKRFEKDVIARQSGKVAAPDSPSLKAQFQMPESIRINPGPTSDAIMKIYDDYSSKICGFKPIQNIDESLVRSQPVVPPNLSQAQLAQAMGASRPMGPTTPIGPNLAQLAGFPPGTRMPGNIDPGLFGGPQTSRMTSSTPTLGPDVNQAFIEQLRASRPMVNATPISGMPPNLEQNQFVDQLRSKVELIVREWMAISFTAVTQQDPRRALAHIVQSMHREGILMTDDTVTKFFQIYVNICVDVTHRLLNSDSQGGQISVRHRCYLTLDAFTKLTCLMVRYSDGPQHSTRINLLKKVLNIVTQALHHCHENRKGEFDGMPFMRIILNLFSNLARVNDPILDPIAWNILECFGHALFVCQPRRAPGFTFHWLTIIGHRDFIGRLLADEAHDPHRTGAMYTQLLLCHIKFLAPYLRNLPLPSSIQVLLKGTLRVLLVILHDFPELLCEYHYVFCDFIPPDCIQLRNLILSAYPRNMRLPDPFNESMEMIENLSDMSVNPKAHREMANIIQDATLKSKLDEYLETRSAVNFLSELPSYLQVSQVPGSKYNASLINAIVLYVGTRAIDALQSKKQKISIQTVAHTPYMDIFQNLAVSLCTEGRHLLFNSIANQLRYPNSHTHYFSCTMLYLFLEANLEIIQEQITRILFQRLVALRPHPWGLLITFVELIRNQQYGFWKHEFIRCAPEIEQLFISVANSCNVNPQQILVHQNRQKTN